MGNTPLSTTQEEKDLGVYVTPNLKPTVQVAKAAASANAMVGMLRKTYTYLDAEMFLPLYKSLIRPRLEHCIQAWSPYTRRDINKLEQVQRRATKLVPELSQLSYEERLSRLGLTPLEERRTRGDTARCRASNSIVDQVELLHRDTKTTSSGGPPRLWGMTL